MFIEKYVPNTIDEIIIDPSTRDLIKGYMTRNTIGNFLFVGSPGIGKTTLAGLIPRHLDIMSLYVHCGMENTVDIMNTKVAEFCDTNAFKIVILDEADSLSYTDAPGRNSAQTALRNIIEKNLSDTRFILTCNYPNKIIPAIKSRCVPICLSCSLSDVSRRVVEIVLKEKIIYDKPILVKFVENVVKKKFPDIRLIMQMLEEWCITGTMVEVSEKQIDHGALLDMIEKTPKPRDIRKYLIENEILFDRNYISLAQSLFSRVSTEHEQNIVAEHIYRMHMVNDVEIQFSSMINVLKGFK